MHRRGPLLLCLRASPMLAGIAHQSAGCLKGEVFGQPRCVADRDRRPTPARRRSRSQVRHRRLITNERGQRHELPEELLTVAEVAPLLRVCKATVYRMVKDGSLPAVHMLNGVRIRRSTLIEFATLAS